MYTHNPWNTVRLWTVGAMLFALANTTAFADTWNKKTELTVRERIEVPGAILEPGNYVLLLVDSDANRHIVRILNERENEVISTVIAIPNYLLKVTGDTQFAWYERPSGEPRALRAWCYPGDNFGQEFVYPKRQASPIAESVHVPVPAADIPEPVMTAKVQPEAPPARELKEVEVKPVEPVQMAQARRPEPAPTPAPQPETAPPALPATAGFGPLLGLLGALSLAAAATLGKALRRG